MAGTNPVDTAERLGLPAPLFDRPWDHDLAVVGLWRASAGLFAASGRLGVAVASGLLREAFASGAKAPGGFSAVLPAASPRAALEAGFKVLDRNLRALQADDAVLAAGRDVLDAGARVRDAQLLLLDRLRRMNGAPTRRELDDLAREVTVLRRALRAREAEDAEAALQASLAEGAG